MDKRVKEYIDYLTEIERDDVYCKYDFLLSEAKTFTPIEVLLWLALKYYLQDFVVSPQVQIGKYRVDFLVTVTDKGGTMQVVVECDGHDFHERTKEQAAKDKTRDRELQRLGFPVVRFTGSEIWKDPTKCAEYMLSFIWDLREHEYLKKFSHKENA